MEQLKIIRTLEGMAELKDKLKEASFIAFDTETTGIEVDSEIIGFSVGCDDETGYYVIFSYWDVTESRLVYLETQSAAKDFMQFLTTKNLVMHNAVFDCAMVNHNFGVDLMPSVHTDTLILAHLLNENRLNGLKELGVALFGEDARKEQKEMKESVHKNGGMLTRQNYELYKADAELIARYGAKDAILTMKVFYKLTEDLFEQGLESFFYDDESMPLLRGPTYDLNTTGLLIDPVKLQTLKSELETECLSAEAFIMQEVRPYVIETYPGTGKTNHFNVNSSKQRAWLLYEVLDEEFHTLTDQGKELCRFFELPVPYAPKDKGAFIQHCKKFKGRIWESPKYNYKTEKMSRPKKVGNFWDYTTCGKDSLKRVASKYRWVERFLEYTKNKKLLNTYVEGIQKRMRYNVIRSSFLQHGTTSGRYSSRNPNFQNLPRDDKRVKACIVSRPGKSFVGADYGQLEPRVFASFSGDERLLGSFKTNDDFYSVIGMEVFDKYDCIPQKDGSPNAFGVKYKQLRDIAKVVALSATYGTTAFKMAPAIGKSTQEAQEVIAEYFEKFPKVKQLMLDSHSLVKSNGFVTSLFGRPRRIPKAETIGHLFPDTEHAELPYELRNLLNLAINHRIQSTGASIVNRAAIAFKKACKEKNLNVFIVLQIHDEVIVECEDKDAETVKVLLKQAMETTVTLPGVDLIAEPKIAKNIADLK